MTLIFTKNPKLEPMGFLSAEDEHRTGPFSNFVNKEHAVRRRNQSIEYVSTSTQTSTPKFGGCDSPHKFAVIF